LPGPFQLHIPRDVYDAVVRHALAELPNECCGLLAGRVVGEEQKIGEVMVHYPLVNGAASPVEYEAEARSMFAAVRDIDRCGLEMLVVYHSHPTADPVPSRKDLARNNWPGVASLIVSLSGAVPTARVWWLTDSDYREADWRVLDSPADPPTGS
jgi:[CysO sulfur-carrier protein]-S-L-cysteine hydrolase